MFGSNNILLFLYTVLPSLLYIWMIYMVIPVEKVSLKKAVNVFFVGFFSITLVKFIHFIFPNYSDPFFKDNILASVFFLAFIQVGLTEELCKYSAYKLSGVENKFRSPIAILLYCAIPAISFAIAENIMYISRYTMNAGEATMGSWELSFRRNLHATTLHLTCGTIIGYFVALSKSKYKESKKWINRFINKTRKRRFLVYKSIGIAIAALVHGAYDLNFFILRYLTGHKPETAQSITTFFTFAGVATIILLVRSALRMEKSKKLY